MIKWCKKINNKHKHKDWWHWRWTVNCYVLWPPLLPLPPHHRTAKTAVTMKWWMLRNGGSRPCRNMNVHIGEWGGGDFNVLASNWSRLVEETIMRNVGAGGGFNRQKSLRTTGAADSGRAEESRDKSFHPQLGCTIRQPRWWPSFPAAALQFSLHFWLHIARHCHCGPVSFHYMTAEPPLTI